MVEDIFKVLLGLAFFAIGIFCCPFLGPVAGVFFICGMACFKAIK